jgi:hypothetical protein
VACDGRNISCGMAYRVAIEKEAKFWVLELYPEQCLMGALGMA